MSKAVTLLWLKVELTAAIVVVVSTATAALVVTAIVVIVVWIGIIFKVHWSIRRPVI